MAVYIVSVARCHLDNVLAEPPAGHRGVYITLALPTWKVGDILSFIVYKDQVLEDVLVKEIEPPGSCKRSDLGDKAIGRYKTHWVEIPKTVLIASGSERERNEAGCSTCSPP